ncbi:MAG TPA: UDP-N-acetylmuramate dehydrogenase [Acidimicrobiia bacterium]
MTLDRVAAELEERLPGRVTRRVPFGELSTYRIGGPVAVLARIRSEAELAAAAGVIATHRPRVLVVGRGSNLLVGDGGFAGVALLLEGHFEALDLDAGAPDDRLVRAGGAVALPVLARRSAAAGLAGLEFFVGIPGSVGGAVRMNAGGHGRETADVLRRARIVDLASGAAPTARGVAELELGYRRSALSPTEVVVAAELAVAPDTPGACEARVGEIVRWRREHQPGGANAGSVFRNPPGDSAGRLIDATGLKGLRVGGAVVSAKHANFFQAEPGATATDVARLLAEVQRRVAEATGVRLVPELLMVGEGFEELDLAGRPRP